jgi:chemotaxis protein methyltransferase CheR
MGALPSMDDYLLVLTDADFRFVSTLVYDTFGIRLTEQKRTLLAGRLSRRVRQLGYSSFHDYFVHLQEDHSGVELSELINRVTTNHSFFFREPEHFRLLAREILPPLITAAARKPGATVRIWSAGCAAGEEPYTLAMILHELMGTLPGGRGVKAAILATDVSMDALMEAKDGVYPSTRVKDLPAAYRKAYLSELGKGLWSVNKEVRSLVTFKRMNLVREKYPFKSQFDIVFCRNVMIYFDTPSRTRLVDAIYQVVKPGGWLFIGHSESLPRETCPFRYMKPASYCKILP